MNQNIEKYIASFNGVLTNILKEYFRVYEFLSGKTINSQSNTYAFKQFEALARVIAVNFNKFTREELSAILTTASDYASAYRNASISKTLKVQFIDNETKEQKIVEFQTKPMIEDAKLLLEDNELFFDKLIVFINYEFSQLLNEKETSISILKNCLEILKDITPEHFWRLSTMFSVNHNDKDYAFFIHAWEKSIFDWINSEQKFSSHYKMLEFSPNITELQVRIVYALILNYHVRRSDSSYRTQLRSLAGNLIAHIEMYDPNHKIEIQKILAAKEINISQVRLDLNLCAA